MKDLTQCTVIREDFERWLDLGKAPITLYQGDKATAMLTRLEKDSTADYLYSVPVASDGSISWSDGLTFCGVWDRRHRVLYMAEDALSCVTEGRYPFAAETIPFIKEEICGRINRRVEDVIANDRSNLAVTEIVSPVAMRDLEYYRNHGAKEEAIRLLFNDSAPDGQFHSGYALEELPEAAFIAWLHDPEYFIETEAEQYIKNRQEKILLEFLENDALLKAFQTLMEDADSPIRRMKAITDAIRDSKARNVTVAIRKDGKELTFRTEAGSLTGYQSWYSILGIPSQDRRRFKELFGRHANYCAEDITKITYGKKTIYEAPPVQTEDMAGPEMGGMNLG